MAITIAHMAIIAALEIVMPARPDWGWSNDRQVFNDIVHGILLDFGGRIGTSALTILLVTLFTANLPGAVWPIWPVAWPFALQLALAIVVYDFGDYWKHRAYHQWNWAWPIHILHHNPPIMHVFNAGRSEDHTSELQSPMRISYAVFCLKTKTHTESCPHPPHENKRKTKHI